jgi:hypothetical protein
MKLWGKLIPWSLWADIDITFQQQKPNCHCKWVMGSKTMTEWVIVVNANSAICSAISWREQLSFQWDDDEVRFVLDQHAELDFYSARSLKQQSADRHVAAFGHIILIPSQPVFALSPKCCVLSEEATNTNITGFGLTWPGLEHMIYRTWGEHANHYATDSLSNYDQYHYILNFLRRRIFFTLKINIHVPSTGYTEEWCRISIIWLMSISILVKSHWSVLSLANQR